MDQYSNLPTTSLSKLTLMYRSDSCRQGLDSGRLGPLRAFYHLLTSTGGLIIVKTLKNKHSGSFLTHIQAVNSRQNIQDIAPDSGSQMIWNDLETPPKFAPKIEKRLCSFSDFIYSFYKSQKYRFLCAVHYNSGY